MPVVNLSDEYDQKLRTLITDFGQTREHLVAKLIDEETQRRAHANENGDGDERLAASDKVIRLDPDAPQNLRFSKIVSAIVDGKPIHRPNWNSVREHMHVLGMGRLGSLDEVAKVSQGNVRSGRYEEDGYRYIPEHDFSLQGVDSNWGWSHSLRLARAMGVSIKITIEWRDREGAAHPGKRGVLEWSP